MDNLQLQLFYEHSFIENHGGNIKISTDNANTWTLIKPEGNYNGFLSDVDAVPEGMRGQSAITGEGVQQIIFDLLEQKGQQVWLRSDFGAKGDLAPLEKWVISEATLSYSTLEAVNGGFDIPRELTLHANYPDPFTTSTTLSYTLADRTPVILEVYDILGRRVMQLVDQEQAAGTYSLQLEAGSLANGLYLLRLQTNQGSEVERMVVSK